MGERARLNAWPLRAAFVALILVGVAVQGMALPAARGNGVLDPARAALQRAGFTVATVANPTWLDGTIRNGDHLVATSPLCAQPIKVEAIPITDRFEQPKQRSAPPLYIFGGWQGSTPSRPRLALAAAWMQLHYAATLGRRGRPIPGMLEVSDPSACLALRSPDWKSIWFG